MPIIEVSVSKEIKIPQDITMEELSLLHLVKQKMLQKLNNRQKFLFVYIFELGNTQTDAAFILGVHDITVMREISRIRAILDPFRYKNV